MSTLKPQRSDDRRCIMRNSQKSVHAQVLDGPTPMTSEASYEARYRLVFSCYPTTFFYDCIFFLLSYHKNTSNTKKLYGVMNHWRNILIKINYTATNNISNVVLISLPLGLDISLWNLIVLPHERINRCKGKKKGLWVRQPKNRYKQTNKRKNLSSILSNHQKALTREWQ